MSAGLNDACAMLTTHLPQAAALTAHPDTGQPGHTKPGSRPPWNGQAAMAVLDALEGARRLHAALHTAVTGQPPRHRSYAQTGRTIVLIAALGAHASRADAEQATRIVFALAAPLRRLPAVDLDERWRKVSGVACRYCGTPMLRLGERSGTVTCLRWGACWDGDGRHPVGFLAHGVGGEPMIAWNDGTNEYADVVPATGGTEAVP